MSQGLPILYSFRRCPYAIRARMALHYSSINCYIREVSLSNKPQDLINISSKATVPVMHCLDGRVIDQSLDIIHYAINNNDPEGISNISQDIQIQVNRMILKNDLEFTPLLNKYKYFKLNPNTHRELHRKQIETIFLIEYEKMLHYNKYFFKKKSIADIAILPFIRQFAFVDKNWFMNSPYKNLIKWLNNTLEEESFQNIILAKYTPWKEGDSSVFLLQ